MKYCIFSCEFIRFELFCVNLKDINDNLLLMYLAKYADLPLLNMLIQCKYICFESNIEYYNNYSSMTQQMSLPCLLNNLKKSLNYLEQEQFQTSLVSSTNIYFYGHVQQEVHQVKKKIINILDNVANTKTHHQLTNTIQRFITILDFRLQFLTKKSQMLIEEEIMTGHMDLCQLYAQSLEKIPQFLSQMTKTIIESMRNLLKLYFMAQHFHKTSSSIEYIQVNKFKQFHEQINKKDLKMLINEQMRKLEEQQQEKYELCRMCSCQIKLVKIQQHVLTCKKVKTIQQEIQSINISISTAMQNIKQICHQLQLKTEQDFETTQFIKIGKTLMTLEHRKEKVNDRRCSLMASKSQSKLQDKISQYIEDYLEEFEGHSVLRQVLTEFKKKSQLQKKLSQMNYQQRISPLKNIQHSHYFSSKKQQEDKNKDKCHQKSSENGSEKAEDKENKFQTSLRCLSIHKSQKKSIKCMSTVSVSSIENIKLYTSLQQIIFKNEEETINLSSFDILKVLGQGAFGKVYLARRKTTKDIYALKAIRIVENDEKELESIKNEHQIFKKIAGDHLVKAPFSFSIEGGQIFVLEYMCGGDLKKLLNEEVYFEEDVAKFYLAQIVLAIQHLHCSGIIHRDLKPQNLVIDKNGHLKLTDFGLSQMQIQQKLAKSRQQEDEMKGKRVRRRRAGMVGGDKNKMKLIGTPDYIAPEIINSVSWSNYSIDWWSLGVMAYQLIIGTRPFCADTIEEVIDNITNFTIEWPEVGQEEGMISSQAKDLICQLLNKNFMERLGAKGVNEIKEHPFFQGIDWQNIKSTKPLYIPKLNSLGEYLKMDENKQLREDLQKFIQGESKKKCKTMKLNNFVRFDLLEVETLEQTQKVQEQHKRRLKKLKTLSNLEMN